MIIVDPVTIAVGPSATPEPEELREPDLAAAVARARTLPGPVRLLLEDGIHVLSQTIALDARDAGLTVAARNPAAAEIRSSWSPETIVETRDEHGRVWVATLPADVRRELEVDGTAAEMARSPEAGYHRIAHAESVDFARGFDALFAGDGRFAYAPGSIPALPVPHEVDVIVPHFWVQERARVTEVNTAAATLCFEPPSIFALRDEKPDTFARFALENVRDAFRNPGQFYVDETGTSPWVPRPSGPEPGRRTLLYRPKDGERLGAVSLRLPRLASAFRLSDDEPVTGFTVQGVRFGGFAAPRELTATPPFHVSEDARLTRAGYATSPQGAPEVPATIELGVAREARIQDCVFDGVGGWAVGATGGASDVSIERCTVLSPGAGAIVTRLSTHARGASASRQAVLRLSVRDNVIRKPGRRFPHAPAIFLQDAAEAVVEGNTITGTNYSGISLGWSWGFDANPSRDNTVERNTIDDVGSGVLSDLGGVYTLGSQPGSRIVGNRISRVRTAHYGAWGIYLDEGSSHILIAGNTCHDLEEHALNIHYGAHLEIRDNTFAFGALGLLSVSRPDRSADIAVVGNTFLTSGRPVYTGRPDSRVLDAPIVAHGNRVWDVAGQPVVAADLEPDGTVIDHSAGWRERGNDNDAFLAQPPAAREHDREPPHERESEDATCSSI